MHTPFYTALLFHYSERKPYFFYAETGVQKVSMYVQRVVKLTKIYENVKCPFSPFCRRQIDFATESLENYFLVLQTPPLATWVPRLFHLMMRDNRKNYGADDGI